VPLRPRRHGKLAAQTTRSQFAADLRIVLAERNFRRLYATRLISQTGDGVFSAGLTAYVFFSAQMFPDPSKAAVAFAVLYLPYSLIGPFAGVFIDRWSRRQILVWSAVARAGFVGLTAGLIASGTLGLPLYVSALAVLGVNRFFLSSLSAALPHVVAGDKLVMANAVGPTSGTIVGFIGGLAGLGVHILTGGTDAGSALVMVVAGSFYLGAGAMAASIQRDLLGPHRLPAEQQRRDLGRELGRVLAGLAAGASHIWRRRPAAAALMATGSFRFLYGILLLMSILLYRNYFYPGGNGNKALSEFSFVVAASAVGYGAAALITPAATKKLTKPAWITVLLAAGGIVTGVLGGTFSQLAFLVIGFALGVVAQGVAICTTTIIQEAVDDDYRGRVFSVNDMLYNTTFVLGAVIAALFMPDTGKSYPMLVVVAAGYLIAAAGYRALSRQPSGRDSPPSASPWPAAQRSSS
jgi:MFS family permease